MSKESAGKRSQLFEGHGATAGYRLVMACRLGPIAAMSFDDFVDCYGCCPQSTIPNPTCNETGAMFILAMSGVAGSLMSSFN